jgi:long-chain acyl-CoA synthetase
MNLVEPVLFQCKLSPLTTAIYVPGSKLGSITYGRLEALIHNIARNSRKWGIEPGHVVATFITDAALHAVFTLGLIYAGATTVSLRDSRPISGLMPDVVLTDVPGNFAGSGTILATDEVWLEGEGAAAAVPPQGGGDEVCRIILTSGSTGIPKGVALSHRALAARAVHYMMLRGVRSARCLRFFCDLSLGTSPGFNYMMAFLSRGGTIYFLGPDPADILQIIDLHQIEGMATSPYGLGEFLRFFEADSAFESSFDHIICQGALLSRELAQRARARMCHNLYSSYGATETSTVAFGPASIVEQITGAVGYIQPGAVIEAVDAADTVLPPLREGHIRIRTEHMAPGYVGDPDATKAQFRDGYFYTRDVGHRTADNLLVITGREQSALNIGGDTVSPELVEAIIADFPGIREAGVFAVQNDLGIAELSALIVSDSPIQEAELRRYCEQRLPPSCVPSRVLRIAGLPRGAQGKLERQRLPEVAAAQNA